MEEKPTKPAVAVGDRVVVSGCHSNYRPVVVSLVDGVAIVQTTGLGPADRKVWAVGKLRKAPPPKKGRRR